MGSSASRLKAVLNFEVSIRRFLTLLLNVLDDYLVGDIPRTGHKISSRPHVPSPKHPAQTLIFHHHFARGLSFEPLHQLTDRDVGRNRDKNMDVIPRNVPSDDFDILTLANFPDQLPGSRSYVADQNWLAVLRDPYKVILQIVNGMAGFPVIFHTASILKSSPQGERFSPIPRVGQ